MKKQILFRKCFKKDGKYYSNNYKFEYPKEGWVEAEYWDPEPKCGYGLHALRSGDNFNYLDGDTWQVFTDYEDLIIIDDDKVKVRKAYVISEIDITEYKKEFLKEAEWAYYYAAHFDKKPTRETRIAVGKVPFYAYFYARDIDKKPTQETREAVCKEPYWAYSYALNIDKKPTKQTADAVSKDQYWASRYLKNVVSGSTSLEEINNE